MITAFFARAWARIWPYVAAVGAGLALLIGVRQSGKSAGRDEVRREMDEQAARAREIAREVDQNLDALDADSVRRRADDWVRKPKG